ncbi:MAG TPA: dihydropteroate synthase [Gemmataceae bacterium]|jgi:dihydropteroate synthase|nr:dihydropteroate synthase [Gemmataceae bacterium]
MALPQHSWQIRGRLLDLTDRPLVLGIVNVTPDSFSDGGRFASVEAGVAQGLRLVEQGADMLDVGGESSRPGAQPVAAEEELARVVPVIERLAKRVAVPISIDTYKAITAQRCLDAGAAIINDISALGDSAMARVVATSGAGVILMHMQGTPATMQQAPHYDDVMGEVRQFFQKRLQESANQGIAVEQVVFDPGIGFGKKTEHNLMLLARLAEFQDLGRPIALGVSRKGLLGRLLDRPLERRMAGSLAVASDALSRGAVQVLRVHDVEETRDAVIVLTALRRQREQTRSTGED